MSTDTNTPAGSPDTQTSVSTTQPPAAPAYPAAAAAQQPQEPAKGKAVVEIPSDELKRRLDETRAKAEAEAKTTFLKSLGVTDETALKTAVEQYKKLEDEKRTDLEKRDVRIKELEPKAQRADALEQVVKRQVDAGLASLNESQRDAVRRLAGDDPLRQLDVIEVFKSALPAAPIAPSPASDVPPAAPKPPIAAPVNTGAPPAPAPTGASSPAIDHLATWNALKERPDGGYSAAAYYTKNTAAIIAAQKARG